MKEKQSPEEKLYDLVAHFLYREGTLDQARKEFCLQLFSDWSKANFDIVLRALTSSELEKLK
ncbi:MAG: hypothetical protein ACFFB2_13115 [Promethearchaeota archaeon]